MLCRRTLKILWVSRWGFGFVWRGTEHQFYRDMDGSMGKRWTHHVFRASSDDFPEVRNR